MIERHEPNSLVINGVAVKLHIDREVWPLQVVGQTEYMGVYEGSYLTRCYDDHDLAESIDETITEIADVIRDSFRFSDTNR